LVRPSTHSSGDAPILDFEHAVVAADELAVVPGLDERAAALPLLAGHDST
jgi:hypothetical protein